MSTKNKKPRWRFLVPMPTAYNPSARQKHPGESSWGRAWTLERDDGKRAVVEVEASPAVFDAYRDGSLPLTARQALQSEGRSAVEQHLASARLPARIHVTAAGVRQGR